MRRKQCPVDCYRQGATVASVVSVVSVVVLCLCCCYSTWSCFVTPLREMSAVSVKEPSWPPLRSKQPLFGHSVPRPQAAAGSVCPSREPPGGEERWRCQERTQTRGGPAGERWSLGRLWGRKQKEEEEKRLKSAKRREADFFFFFFNSAVLSLTFTVTDLLLNIVHFQVFGNGSSSEKTV